MKMHKWWIIIPIIVFGIAIYIVFQAYNYEKLPQTTTYDISEMHNLNEPYIDLTKLEKSVNVVYNPGDSEYTNLTGRSSPSHILKDRGFFPTTIIRQACIGYSLENEEKIVCYPYLSTEYFIEGNSFTIDEIFKKNHPYRSMLNEEFEQKDERFEKCYVSVYKRLEGSDKISIMVVKNKQIMYLEYDGGFLTVDDFLDELDRIL